MKTTKEAFDNLSNAMANLGRAIRNNEAVQLVFFTCASIAAIWIIAAFVRLIVEVIKAGYNWQL